jgi:zinc-finger-containing domain
MVLFTSKEAKYPKNGKPRKYYRCANTRECGTACGAHPDGTPLGIPGDVETISARNTLHHVFDQLWLSGRWSRKEAYAILQLLTGLGEKEAHIGRFDQDLCGMLILRLKEFLELNPYKSGNNGAVISSKYRFVYLKRGCTEHGLEVHRVYLEGRQEFCVNCLDQKKGPVWWSFLIFIKERAPR